MIGGCVERMCVKEWEFFLVHVIESVKKFFFFFFFFSYVMYTEFREGGGGGGGDL